MKKLMTATAVLALMAGTSALAQDEHRDRGDRGAPPPHAAPQGGRPAMAAPAARPAAPQGQGAPVGPRYTGAQGAAAPAYRQQAQPNGAQGYRGEWHGRAGEQSGARPQDQGRPVGGNFQGDARARGDRGADRGDFRQGRPGWGAPGFNPGGRDHPRYDPQFYPRQIRPDRQFRWRGEGWRPQRGFYYRRWAFGEYLPFGWFDQSYWVGDYYDYDLPVPPYGYQWVRVGPDVLLINLATGFVAETVYGLFY
ncbi:MAG TPA: RcnB family protein [Caulobacteraceae bacterium]|jgi:Ni/Co efflux regulator RcnB